MHTRGASAQLKREVRSFSAPRRSTRLPVIADVDRFIAATSDNRVLRLAVLNDLRDRSRARVEVLAFASVCLVPIAALASFAFSVAVSLRGAARIAAVQEFSTAAAVIAGGLILLLGAFVVRMTGAHHASVWLAAYDDAIAEQGRSLDARACPRCGDRRLSGIRAWWSRHVERS